MFDSFYVLSMNIKFENFELLTFYSSFCVIPNFLFGKIAALLYQGFSTNASIENV